MKYQVRFRVKEQCEQEAGRHYDEDNLTSIEVKKIVEADSEKEAIQKVVDLLGKGGK